MGVGAEADEEYPSLRKSPLLGWGLHLGVGWRAAVGSGAPSWHAATDDGCLLVTGQLPPVLDTVAAIRAGSQPPAAIDGALSATTAGPWWSDAKGEAMTTCGLPALYDAMVRAFGRLMR